jgi:hypothetical protein
MSNKEPFECELEIPAQMCVDLKAKVTANFYEGKGITPTNIIRCNSESRAEIVFDFTDSSELKRLLCGKICVCLAWESCGTAPEGKKCKTIEFNLCKNLKPSVEFSFPSDCFKCPDPSTGECGDLYSLCITAAFLDCENKPVGIGAYCKGPYIYVMP